MSELITDEERNAVAKIDATVASMMQEMTAQAGNKITIALAQAKAATILKSLLTDEIIGNFSILQGSKHGFETDIAFKGQKYPNEVVRDCLLEAMLYGLRPVGGEWMVISSRCYITKAGFERLARALCKNYAVQLGDVEMPKQAAGTAFVSAQMFFETKDGHRHEIRCRKSKDFDARIPVRVNKGMGVDGVLGKARRKGLKQIVEAVSGMEISDAEQTEDELTQTQPPAIENSDAGTFEAEAAEDEAKRSGEKLPPSDQLFPTDSKKIKTPYDKD